MATDGTFVYVLRGDWLLKFKAQNLELVARVRLPELEGPPRMPGPSPGGPPGMGMRPPEDPFPASRKPGSAGPNDPSSLPTELAISTPAEVVAPAKHKAPPDYAHVFESGDVPAYHLVVAAPDWQRIWRRPFDFVKATVRYGGEEYREVGLRFKGNSSSSVRGLKKSYKIKFNEYTKGLRFHGFEELNFNNAFKDPTFLREKLAYGLMREAGVPCSRADFARLYLTVPGHYDGEYLGLFTLVEPIEEPLLDDRFGSHNGALYEPAGPMGLLIYRGEEESAYAQLFDDQSKGDKQGYASLARFLKVVSQTPDDSIAEAIAGALDVPSFLAWLAANTLLVNWDSYAGTGHNYYLYEDPKTHRMVFVPWDLNEAFGGFVMGDPAQTTRASIHAPYAPPKILIERVLAVQSYRKAYLEKLESLLAGTFREEVLLNQIEVLVKRIRFWVAADPWKLFPLEAFDLALDDGIYPGGSAPMEGGVIGLRRFVRERITSVRAQLARQDEGYRLPAPRDPGWFAADPVLQGPQP